MDRLGFWGMTTLASLVVRLVFQYPLMDRLGFWGRCQLYHADARPAFQYPLMDRLGFWGRRGSSHSAHQGRISVSADGSTWFLGFDPAERGDAVLLDFSIR